jgi:hypothetical protein
LFGDCRLFAPRFVDKRRISLDNRRGFDDLKSLDKSMNMKPALRSFLFAASALAAAFVSAIRPGQTAQYEKRAALVIGNSAYEHTTALRNPVNDARAMAAVLERLGFDVTAAYDASAERFAAALEAFSYKVVPAQVALFYYAGHGLQFSGKNYLLPVDARLSSQFSLKREAFAVDDVLQPMESADRVNLVFLDSCRNNPLAEQLKRSIASPTRAASIGRGLARIEPLGHDTLIVFATAPGEEAGDGGGRHSPFTEALLRHIETPGVDVEVMLKRVTGDVRRATGERQRPERLARLAKEFSFKPANGQIRTGPRPRRPASAEIGEQSGRPDYPGWESFDKPAVQTYRVASGVSEGILNMRSGPGQGHRIIVSIPARSGGIVISGCRRADDRRSRYPWCKARWRDHTGWLSKNGLVKE